MIAEEGGKSKKKQEEEEEMSFDLFEGLLSVVICCTVIRWELCVS